MVLVLAPNQVYYIRENPFREYLQIKCQDDFELDGFDYPGNSLIIFREVMGEPASRHHTLKNIANTDNVCEIQEYFIRGGGA